MLGLRTSRYPYSLPVSTATHYQYQRYSHAVRAQLRGIDPPEEARAVGLGQHLIAGRLDALTPGSFHILLGEALAQELGVKVGDSVVLIAPQGTATPTGIGT